MSERVLARWGWFFVAPALAFFLLTVVYPFLFAVYMSLHDWPLLGHPSYVGLDNYRRMWSDPLFRKALANTARWVAGVVPPTLFLGLFLASLLNHPRLRARGIFRTIYYVPVVTNMVAASFVWRWLFEPTLGVVNYGVRAAGFAAPQWLADPDWALLAMMVVAVWKQLGFAMVVFLAGLQTLPRHLLEAAEIDGATSWQRFWHVTVPLLNPTVVFVAVILVINALRVFTIPYVMSSGGLTHLTPGGPLDSTRVFVLHIYDLAFRRLDLGYAAANAMFLMVLILVVTLVQLRLMQRPFQY